MMTNMMKHPSALLPEYVVKCIREEAFDAEQKRMLTEAQLKIIYERRWLNMYVPKAFGGLQLSFPEILRTEEALAWVDGSVSWFVTLCSGAAWFIGFLDRQLADQLFKNANICFAGSGAATGTANKTRAGYEISGFWKYATGALHANVFTVNCQVKENGMPQLQADGSPVIQSFVLLKDEVQVHNTWNSMGMIATGSHAFEVKHAVVPFNRLFTIQPGKATLDDIIFQYPFLQLAETTLAVNLSGMAVRFLDLCTELFSNKGNDVVNRLHDTGQTLLNARDDFYRQTDAAWEELLKASVVAPSTLTSISNVSHQLVTTCRRLVNDLYPNCGLYAADMRTEINRAWRNFHTAGQHSLFGTSQRPA
jgi:hypothetical protein